MKCHFPGKQYLAVVKLPMEDACGQDQPGVTSVAPFANTDLKRRAEVCLFKERVCAESSGLPRFLLWFV